MARIDSLLAIVVQQGANELRLGTDREPKMLAHGSARRFHMPETNEETLRALLGDILSTDRERQLGERGRIEVPYETNAGAAFHVSLTARPSGGFDAVFLRTSSHVPVARPERIERVEREEPGPPDSFEAPSPSSGPQASVVEAPRPAFSLSLQNLPLVQQAIASRATDLHLVDSDAAVLRIDGRLTRLEGEVVDDVVATLHLDPSVRAILAKGQSVELSAEVDWNARARVHLYRAATGNAAAIRFFARTPSSLASLDFPVPLDDLVDIPHGLVIVCGATGSGKSTTLAALAHSALQRRSIVLVTLEDPIEYVLAGGSASIVRQRQVGRDVHDFATGLRDALREDPDVLVVGEMRDPETIALALTAAETGHLVFATLHSGGAASAVERIVDSYPAERQSQIRTQLADSLRAVVAQRLLPRARGAGRIPAVEVLRMNHAAASLVREAKTAQLTSVLQSGRREGMITLERSLADRVLAGEVRIEHARAAANDLAALTMYLNK
ncbi:Twitching motility protein PilT [Labilithrix luteola]|uniref:Twitching motility protein PilT n=1 Tax=Labilithrix luteola TaxID=1391654 RepID=A0A0K1PS71_9BACT|nr:PilT/PilU family type 4a pilus ATPase [Labilithrix luteola]AKU96383.1 Twitching motility protein PilT [Labilithrix luteola]